MGTRRVLAVLGAALTCMAAAVTVAGPSAAAPSQAVTAPAQVSTVARGSGFVALSPLRLYDTRATGDTLDGLYRREGPIGAGETGHFGVFGRTNVLFEQMDALVLNVTAVAPTADTHLTVHASADPRPATSNLNVTRGAVASNQVVVRFGRVVGNDDVRVFNAAGAVDVVVDIVGYYPPGVGVGTPPTARLLDTRAGGTTVDGQGAGAGPVRGGETRLLRVAGRGGVPATGVAAVVLNVVGIRPTTGAYLTVWPSGTTRPLASSLNLRRGEVHANLVTTPMGPDGTVAIFLPAGAMDVVADVQAWLPVGPAFTPLVPGRLLDTRGQATVDGQGMGSGSLGPGRSVEATVTGRHGIPATGVSAVVLNLTAVAPSADTFLSAFASDAVRPASSVGNVVAGETRPNLAVVEVGTEGRVRVYNRNGTVNVVADVVGWFASGPPVTVAPTSLPDGTVGLRYGNGFSNDVVASGGGAFFCDVSVVRGALPIGLSIPLDGDEELGIGIAGTPLVAGRYDFTLRGDCGGTVALRDYTVMIRSGPLEITTTTVEPWVIGLAGERQLAAKGGTGPYSWRVLSGSLPPGIVLSAAGRLTGTPRGPFSLTTTSIAVTDSVGSSVATAFPLFVNDFDLNETYADGFVGQPYVSSAPHAFSASASYTWSVGGSLPAGLTIDPATGVLSGTPALAGTTSFVLSVVDASGHHGRLPVTIVVSP